jgi:hypothetical protein
MILNRLVSEKLFSLNMILFVLYHKYFVIFLASLDYDLHFNLYLIYLHIFHVAT